MTYTAVWIRAMVITSSGRQWSAHPVGEEHKGALISVQEINRVPHTMSVAKAEISCVTSV